MHSLRFRIAAAYVLLLGVTMVALGLTLSRMDQARLQRSLDERLIDEARLVGEGVAPALRAGSSIDVVDPIVKRMGQAGGARVTVIGPDGVVLGDSENDPRALENHGSRPEVVEARAHGAGRSTRHSATENRDFTYVAYAIRDGETLLGFARASLPLSEVNAQRQRVILTLAVTTALATAAAALLAVLIAGAVTRPLARLRDAARALAHGAFERRVQAAGGAEVADLAHAFNDMTARLSDTVTTLAEEQSRLRALLAAGSDALIVVGADETVRYLNPAAVRRFGAVLGRPFAEAVRSHEITDLFRRAAATRREASAMVHSNPDDAWYHVSVSPITGGGDWATLAILHDVTETRRAEIARRDFVANVSHELRTPLAGIKAVVETLRDGAVEDPEAASEFLERLDGEVDRLVQMVEELLHLARIEAGTPPVVEAVAPAELLTSCIERFALMAERAGVTLTLDAPAGLPVIDADPAALGRAVDNLIHNAIKFTPPGGRVRVAAGATDQRLRITVQDTGAGIDPADLPRIFERFYVTDRARSRRGAGLGLAIVKHVALAHGGTARVTSRPGEGSTFTIELPLSAPALRSAP